MTTTEAIQYLKSKHTEAEVFESCDAGHICLRHTIGSSQFYYEAPEFIKLYGKIFKVPITDTKKLHIDSVELDSIKSKM